MLGSVQEPDRAISFQPIAHAPKGNLSFSNPESQPGQSSSSQPQIKLLFAGEARGSRERCYFRGWCGEPDNEGTCCTGVSHASPNRRATLTPTSLSFPLRGKVAAQNHKHRW